MRTGATVLMGLVVAACARLPTVEPVGANEVLIVAETARVAGVLGLEVRGAISERPYVVPAGQQGCPAVPATGCYAAGWYVGGVAYYWRGWVARADAGEITFVATHEVCHARDPVGHGPAWVACMERGGYPGAGATIAGEGGDRWVE